MSHDASTSPGTRPSTEHNAPLDLWLGIFLLGPATFALASTIVVLKPEIAGPPPNVCLGAVPLFTHCIALGFSCVHLFKSRKPRTDLALAACYWCGLALWLGAVLLYVKEDALAPTLRALGFAGIGLSYSATIAWAPILYARRKARRKAQSSRGHRHP